MKLLRHGASLRSAPHPMRWLHRVADNACFDLLRSGRRARLARPLDEADDLVHPGVAPDVRRTVLDALGALSDEDKRNRGHGLRRRNEPAGDRRRDWLFARHREQADRRDPRAVRQRRDHRGGGMSSAPGGVQARGACRGLLRRRGGAPPRGVRAVPSLRRARDGPRPGRRLPVPARRSPRAPDEHQPGALHGALPPRRRGARADCGRRGDRAPSSTALRLPMRTRTTNDVDGRPRGAVQGEHPARRGARARGATGAARGGRHGARLRSTARRGGARSRAPDDRRPPRERRLVVDAPRTDAPRPRDAPLGAGRRHRRAPERRVLLAGIPAPSRRRAPRRTSRASPCCPSTQSHDALSSPAAPRALRRRVAARGRRGARRSPPAS